MQFINLWVVVVAALLLAPGCATTGTPTTRKIDELNRKAMVDFKAGDAQKAQEKLRSAVHLAEKEKVTSHPSLAETHMNLGVVAATGAGPRKKAVDEMAKALAIQPDITPEKKWRNAKVDKAFASAQKRASVKRQKDEDDKSKALAVAVATPPPETKAVAKVEAKVEEKIAPVPPSEPVSGKKSKAKKKADAAEAQAAKKAEAAKDPVAPTAPVVSGPPVEAVVEAKVPDPVPEPVFCPLPDEVPPGKDLAIWCAADPALHAKKASLFVRPPDQSEFTKLEMQRSSEGWWVATVPGASVKGTLLQFYVQAEKQNGEALAATGNNESPSLVLLRAGARPARSVITQGFLDGEDVPAPITTLPEVVEEPSSGFQWANVWIALQAGTAYGWHSAANLEFRQDIEVGAGTASAGTLHILPEFGYRLSDRWSTSLQVRVQKLPSEGDTGGRPGGPAPGAVSALLRALYERPVSKRLSLAGSLYLGGGEGVRFVMDPVPSMGRSGTDSVRSGPLLVGAGIGMFFGVTKRFALTGDLRTLVGAPDLGVLGEFNLGLRYAFR